PPKYDDAPSIEFREITTKSSIDSMNIDIKLYFRDGTGDIGLTQADTGGIYKSILHVKKINDSTFAKKHSRNFMNYWLDIYVKKDGEFVQVKSPDEYHTNPANFYIFDGRFKPFNENFTTDKSPLEGFLNYNFTMLPIIDPTTVTYRPEILSGDSIMFKIRILDRKLNVSNTVSTTKLVAFVPQ
ncbi:MAG TPA: hypothetical protein VL947_00380, partial [Cytophagales bacterium]|nr:hypothetical protein [Cytophagales bacterium]